MIVAEGHQGYVAILAWYIGVGGKALLHRGVAGFRCAQVGVVGDVPNHHGGDGFLLRNVCVPTQPVTFPTYDGQKRGDCRCQPRGEVGKVGGGAEGWLLLRVLDVVW